MKLAILSRNTALYSTRRLVEAARAQGHVVRVLDPLRCYLRIVPGAFELHHKGRALRGYDAVIPRIGASITRYGTAVVRQFELMGVYSPNGGDAIARARDKLRCHQLVAACGLGMPLTVAGDSPDDTADLLALLGPPPHIVKLNQGSQGLGVVLTDTVQASRSVTEAFRGLSADFLVQEFVAEAGGSDLRCLVVGERVVAAMQRQAGSGEFRANLHRGGSAQAASLDAAEADAAVRAARSVGLEVAGVDLLRSHRGPLVLEVNASPGLEGIEAASGMDVAAEIIRHVARHAAQRPAAGTSPRRARRPINETLKSP
ncbi:MAG TPA: 30S ribosomal protein S6--L-glutamate ligase [Chiayiivirga sp.]|uniref:Probable alpha-L-glutamate ligase n=1 Tax=Denitratimonas tolerans TaxID=1338420 RepID=A0AAW9R7Q4_9GAMM|nr:30S ribosomal protein S6--L-glutamate ligase [Chiayiivirga sp.]HRO86736.1 30S ribosomal protein S6--L-glutamate ligase [Chiayiivirga sp.]